MLKKSKMGSAELSELKELEKNLKPLIKEKVVDFILFGSALKGKNQPKDLDVGIITNEEIDLEKVSEIRSHIKKTFEEVDTEVILLQELYSTEFGFNLLMEGYSIRKESFLNEVLGIHPYNIYTYSLKELDKSRKPAFSRALKKIIERLEGEKIGRGSIKVPKKNSGDIEDFLKRWGVWKDTECTEIFSY